MATIDPAQEAAIAKFDRALRDFVEQVDIDIRTVTRRLTLQIFTGVVQKTPVDTGRARSNWGINVGGPAEAPSHARAYETKSGRPRKRRRNRGQRARDNAASRTLQQQQAYAEAAVANITAIPDSVYITNNLPYIVRLEEGHSQQAPAGMVATTIAEVGDELSGLL